jgi:predicted DCC family thiol-disulfide oxidoreductase YuxK
MNLSKPVDALDTTPDSNELAPPTSRELEVFFDGECPLCLREAKLMRRLDRKDALELTDISKPGFEPPRYDKSMQTFMDKLWTRRGTGEWVEGVESFRAIYEALGYRRLVSITRWPLIRQAMHLGYILFAKNRLRMTGRCSPDAKSCPLPKPPTN